MTSGELWWKGGTGKEMPLNVFPRTNVHDSKSILSVNKLGFTNDKKPNNLIFLNGQRTWTDISPQANGGGGGGGGGKRLTRTKQCFVAMKPGCSPGRKSSRNLIRSPVQWTNKHPGEAKGSPATRGPGSQPKANAMPRKEVCNPQARPALGWAGPSLQLGSAWPRKGWRLSPVWPGIQNLLKSEMNGGPCLVKVPT